MKQTEPGGMELTCASLRDGAEVCTYFVCWDSCCRCDGFVGCMRGDRRAALYDGHNVDCECPCHSTAMCKIADEHPTSGRQLPVSEFWEIHSSVGRIERTRGSCAHIHHDGVAGESSIRHIERWWRTYMLDLLTKFRCLVKAASTEVGQRVATITCLMEDRAMINALEALCLKITCS